METKRLYRVQEGKLIAGVSTGLARHFNVDVTWVRVAFALAAVMSVGMAFWAYVFLWVITPKSADAISPVEKVIDGIKGIFATPPQGYPKPDQPQS